MKNQQNKILSLLRQMKSVGVNNYDFTYIYHIKQAPIRILELKQQGYNIISHKIAKNRNVQYILLDGKIDPPTTEAAGSSPKPLEAELIPVKKNGYIFWEKPEDVKTEQLDILSDL